MSGAAATANGAFGSGAFGVTPTFGAVSSSPLSYVYEPPDLKAVPEPNVVVAFKNLQKKDSTTKAKALEELQSFVHSLNAKKEGVDDAILEAWVGLSWRVLWMYFRVIIYSHLLDQDLSSYLHRQCTSGPSACSRRTRARVSLLR